MVYVLRKLALSRRTFLRGAGAGLALPWLDAMLPAGQSAPSAPVRALFVFAPNGVRVDAWKPRGTAPDGVLSPTLEPLAPLRTEFTVLSGLAIDGGRAHGDGPGDHARAASSFLTCAHPVKTGGADIRVGVSIDQVIAAELGARTPFPSLEVGMEEGRSAGVCDSGYSCAYSNNVSWSSPSTPVAKQADPRAVFERLFGDPSEQRTRAEEARRRVRLRSVLDAALADFKRLRRDLATADQQKLDQYADAVRAVEERIERMELEDGQVRAEVPADVLERYQDDGFSGRVQLMYELLALAFETDRARVATFMLGNGGSGRSHRFLGVPEGHHELSHHGRDPGKLERIGRIDRFHIERLAEFLSRLRATREGPTSLLDASMVVYGSGISDGNRHNHDDLPILIAGRGGGRLRAAGQLAFDTETPLANLYLTMLRALGIERDAFADSDGVISRLLA